MPPFLETKWWGWGSRNESFRFPAPSTLWRYLSEKLGPLGESPRIDTLDEVPISPSRLSDGEVERLREILGQEGVSLHPHARAVHSLGKSYSDLIRIRRGEIPRPTDAVVYPESEAHVVQVLELAQECRWSVIPFGGGTSVVGGVEPGGDDSRPAVTVDLRRLNRVTAIDAESRLATVQCGIFGPPLEEQLNAAGYTLGHFPQSFQFSTLGGWVATRSAGQSSTKYGKIENLVARLRIATPAGIIETALVPAAATGPDLLQALIGSEGAYGIFTQATVKVSPIPRHRRFACFLFHSFHEGVAAVRTLMQMGSRPAVVRLSDEDESEMAAVLGGLLEGVKNRVSRWWIERKGFPYTRSSLLILGFESPGGKWERALMEGEVEAARETMKRHGGFFIGDRPGKKWYKKRFSHPYLRDCLLDRAVMVDTVETATTWQNLMTLHGAVKQSISRAIEKEGETPLVLTHLSHAYDNGASLYTTFLARQKAGEEIAEWQRAKRAATDAVVAGGGALSHHHGIGSVHEPWMKPYLGDLGLGMIRSIKSLVDPEGIMNPGVLLGRGDDEALAKNVRGDFSHRTRARNLDRFVNERFDVAIVGGGITGSAIARDAALRGMKVALVEKGDFASGTSSKSSKMIHGGLRYLKQLDIKFVKESLREREVLLHLAPHLVEPAPYLIPSYKGQLEQLELHIGMMGYDYLAGTKSVASHRKLGKEEVLRLEPRLKKEGLRGGFLYYDCLVNDARLTLATLKSAAEHGAAVANYVECVGLETDSGAVHAVRFKDVVDDREGTLHAKVIVNATGVWADRVRSLTSDHGGSMLRPTKGIHIVVRREALRVHHVVVHTASDGRTIFAVPCGTFTYIGTTDTDYEGPLDDVRAEADDVSYLLESINDLFEDEVLSAGDVVSTWAGLRPLLNGEGSPSALSRDYRIVVGDSELVTVLGGKLTTHRSMAEAVLDEVLERFGDRFEGCVSECRTTEVPLFGGDIADFEKYRASELEAAGERFGPSSRTLARLLRYYGTDYLKILSLGVVHRQWLEPLSRSNDVLKGEIVYAVEDEMAMTLEDFMERRTGLRYFDSMCGVDMVENVARLMATRLRWDESERNRQLEAYRNGIEKSINFRGDPLSVS